MKNMCTILMDVNSLNIFGIDISSNIRALIYY